MHFTSAIAALAMLASTASAQLPLENVASFETYSNADCSPQGTQQQNINSNKCNFLPGQSARVFFLEKMRGNCRLEFYTSSDCSGTPTDVISSTPSACLNVSSKFSYQAICERVSPLPKK